MKFTEAEWVKAYRIVGKEYFHISGRVIRHIRNAYKGLYDGYNHSVAIAAMIKDSEKKLTGIKATYRAIAITIAGAVLKEPRGLKNSMVLIGRLSPKEMVNLTGCIDKIGFHKSIITYLKRVSLKKFNEILTIDVITESKNYENKN